MLKFCGVSIPPVGGGISHSVNNNGWHSIHKTPVIIKGGMVTLKAFKGRRFMTTNDQIIRYSQIVNPSSDLTELVASTSTRRQRAKRKKEIKKQ